MSVVSVSGKNKIELAVSISFKKIQSKKPSSERGVNPIGRPVIA
jgi:hypothetical protein